MTIQAGARLAAAGPPLDRQQVNAVAILLAPHLKAGESEAA